MSTLAHIFEAAGLATVTLGSIRKQIESTAPPRGLFCDFPLGRPLGKPNDPEFQHRVLSHAFALLQAAEPVLEEFPEAIQDDGSEGMACPLPPRSNEELHPALDEVRGLRPAFDRAIKQYGDRVSAGRVVPADDIEEALSAFIRVADGVPWKEAGIPGMPSRVAQDIRAFYEMAALGLSDHVPSAWSGSRWFFDSTKGGKAILAAKALIRDAGEDNFIWGYLSPLDQ
ncbi:MAG: hypothetical protein GY866_13360 [Proteobacteria bacterium]|nr:hypothetical protein [Pseudomonadota bacterium]